MYVMKCLFYVAILVTYRRRKPFIAPEGLGIHGHGSQATGNAPGLFEYGHC